jgi:hypothetical protein
LWKDFNLHLKKLKSNKKEYPYTFTLELVLWYPKDKDFNLTAYTDADWAGSIDDRKNTSGGEFLRKRSGSMVKKETNIHITLYSRGIIHWCCIMLHTSTLDEANFRRPKISYNNPITINCDNSSAISISKNLVMHSKTKHILIRYHFLRDQVTKKIDKIMYVDTKEQIADIFTKPLPMSTFENLHQKLGVIQKTH